MLYYYLVTVYKGIVALVTPERLIGVALGALGLYVIWMCISLIASFQRKFNSRCQELINYTIRTKDIEKSPELLDKMADRISSGFGFGWKKFRNSAVGKPSDFITRREALEVEVNGGLLNNGKTMMRAYISFVTFVLAIFNFVYVGGESALTFMVFAEALVLPLVFFVVIKLFYFLHNSIKQKLYRMDIESFYEVVDLLDARFEKKGRYVVSASEEEFDEENAEEKTEEDQPEENLENEETEEEDLGLDKYDIFKKKNIDVSKIMNETPKSDSSLPFINVDSDYVIKDDDQVGAKQVGQDDNLSTLFGGMMQNTNGSKKNTFVDVEKSIAEVDEEKLENLANSEKESAEIDVDAKIEESVIEGNIESEETEEKKTEQEENPEEIREEPVGGFEEGKKFKVEINRNDDVKPNVLHDSVPDVDLTPNSNKFIEIEKNERDELALQEENIASVVSGFKANRSKLASGGMIIERNEPIAKRDRGAVSEVRQEVANETYQQPTSADVNKLNADEDTENVLNTLKSMPGSYESAFTGNQVFAPTTNYGNVGGYDQGYGYNAQPMYQAQMNNPMQGYAYNQPVYPSYNQAGYDMGMNQMQNEPVYAEEDDFVEDTGIEEKQKKQKTVRTKENEPRPRNLKSTAKKAVKEEVKEVEKRGRPRKQEVSESMVIENDKQFNEVLARAEKLMRKNEEGLSESQSKRIEKEIKILMDAMNRYKESK